MSTEELKDFCKSVSPYQLRVKVRLKSGAEAMTGRITQVEAEKFQLTTDDKTVEMLRYAWVARITNA
jgi:hypothetical protein